MGNNRAYMLPNPVETGKRFLPGEIGASGAVEFGLIYAIRYKAVCANYYCLSGKKQKPIGAKFK